MGLGAAALPFGVAAALALAGSRPQVAARIATGQAPCEAAASAGAVWVADDGAGTLVRVDPRRNRVTARIDVGRGACAVAAGAGALWVANYRTGLLLRVDPRTRRVRRASVGGAPFDVVVAFGRVWTTGFGNGTLVAVNPHTLRIVRRTTIGGSPTGLLAAAGSIWVGLGRASTRVLRVDPASGTPQPIDVGVKAPSHFVTTDAGIWVVDDGDALALLDPADGRVVRTRHFGRTLVQPALAPDGTLWVPDKEIDTIFRVDPATGELVDSFPGGDGAFQALRAFRSMWVTSYAGSDIWRFRTGR